MALDRVLTFIDENERALADLVTRLVGCRSDLGRESAIQRDVLLPYARAELAACDVDIQSVCPRRDRPFLNLALEGEGRGGPVLLNGHVEVVPVGEGERARWRSAPFEPLVRDGHIFGRGASDMKGGVAAILFALKAITACGARPAGDALVSLVCGEETGEPEIGSVAAASRFRERGWEPALAVIAEPTNLGIELPAAGQVDFAITVEGRECHTAARNLALYPQAADRPQGRAVGVDAFAHLARLLLFLEDVEREWVLRRPPAAGAPGAAPAGELGSHVATASLNRTFVRGGSYGGAVPGEAQIDGVITYPAWMDRGELERELRERLAAYCAQSEWLSERPPTLTFGAAFDEAPCEIAGDDPAAAAIASAAASALGAPPARATANYVGDATFLRKRAGVPAAYYGPGALWMGVHGPDEHVPIRQVVAAAKTFATLLIRGLP